MKKKNIFHNFFHFRRAVKIIEEQFVNMCIEDQGLLDTPESTKKLLSVITDDGLRSRIQNEISNYSSGRQKWEIIVRELKSKTVSIFKIILFHSIILF